MSGSTTASSRGSGTACRSCCSALDSIRDGCGCTGRLPSILVLGPVPAALPPSGTAAWRETCSIGRWSSELLSSGPNYRFVMAKQQILIVDSDQRAARALEVSLRAEGYRTVLAGSLGAAVDALGRVRADLIVADIDLPDAQPGEVLPALRVAVAGGQAPVLFVSSDPALGARIEAAPIELWDVLPRPVFVREAVARVRALLASFNRRLLTRGGASVSRVEGSLDDVALVDLIRILEEAKRSGWASFTLGGQRARLDFAAGQLLDAELGRLHGEEAVYRLLCWKTGYFEVNFEPNGRMRALATSTQDLILEGLRRGQEIERLAEQLPPSGWVLDLDHPALLGRLHHIPDELNAVLKLLDGSRDQLAVINASPFEDLSTLAFLAKLHGEGLLIAREPTRHSQSVAEGSPSRSTQAPAPLAKRALEAVPTGAESLQPRIRSVEPARRRRAGATRLGLAPEPVFATKPNAVADPSVAAPTAELKGVSAPTSVADPTASEPAATAEPNSLALPAASSGQESAPSPPTGAPSHEEADPFPPTPQVPAQRGSSASPADPEAAFFDAGVQAEGLEGTPAVAQEVETDSDYDEDSHYWENQRVARKSRRRRLASLVLFVVLASALFVGVAIWLRVTEGNVAATAELEALVPQTTPVAPPLGAAVPSDAGVGRFARIIEEDRLAAEPEGAVEPGSETSAVVAPPAPRARRSKAAASRVRSKPSSRSSSARAKPQVSVDSAVPLRQRLGAPLGSAASGGKPPTAAYPLP